MRSDFETGYLPPAAAGHRAQRSFRLSVSGSSCGRLKGELHGPRTAPWFSRPTGQVSCRCPYRPFRVAARMRGRPVRGVPLKRVNRTGAEEPSCLLSRPRAPSPAVVQGPGAVSRWQSPPR